MLIIVLNWDAWVIWSKIFWLNRFNIHNMEKLNFTQILKKFLSLVPNTVGQMALRKVSHEKSIYLSE